MPPLWLHVTQAAHLVDVEPWALELIAVLTGCLDEDNRVNGDFVSALQLVKAKGVPCAMVMFHELAQHRRAAVGPLPLEGPTPEPCAVCEGSGAVICPKCEGTGFLGGVVGVVCNRCDGQQKVRCPECSTGVAGGLKP